MRVDRVDPMAVFSDATDAHGAADSDPDVRPAAWVTWLDDRLARRGLPASTRRTVLGLAMLAAIPAAWATLVAPLLLVSATIEWLVRNYARLHAHHGVAIALSVGAVGWVVVVAMVFGYAAGRRTGRPPEAGPGTPDHLDVDDADLAVGSPA